MSPTRSAALRSESMGTSWSSTDRKSTRLNSSHANISYAVFCLKKKNNVPIKLVDKPTSENDVRYDDLKMSKKFSCFHVLSKRERAEFFFFFNDTATTEIYTLSLHDALPI